MYVCELRSDGIGDVGKCKDAEYNYTKVSGDGNYVFDIEGTGEDVDTPTLFVELKTLGIDAREAQVATHYGNQIAYELLRLGYTVLYKELSNLADLADSD